MALDYENEMILLTAWTKGNHREDMRIFEPAIFKHGKLFEALLDSPTIAQLSVKIKDYGFNSVTDLLKADDYGAFYYGARGDALKAQQDRYIQMLRAAAPEEQPKWTEKIAEITNFINEKETQPKSANFSDLFINELTERRNESNPRYGVKPLDRETEGLHRGQLVVLSARPGCGKSAMALQIANNVVNAGYKVLYLPLEMTEYETFQRMIVQEQIVYNSDEAKNPTAEQLEDIKAFLDSREKSGLFCMYYGLNSIAAIEKKIKEEQPFLVVVDQLTQVETIGKAKDIRDKYIQITNTLKRIALTEKVCILALHQLNRASTDRRTPGIENLAESDSVGRDSDVVLMLAVDEDEDYKALKSLDLIIAKNRQGRTGARIPMMFHGARYTFCETAPARYEEQIENDDVMY